MPAFLSPISKVRAVIFLSSLEALKRNTLLLVVFFCELLKMEWKQVKDVVGELKGIYAGQYGDGGFW